MVAEERRAAVRARVDALLQRFCAREAFRALQGRVQQALQVYEGGRRRRACARRAFGALVRRRKAAMRKQQEGPPKTISLLFFFLFCIR